MLVDMTSKEWGQSTAHLGWDAKAWNEWYAKEFVPFLAAKREVKDGKGEKDIKKDAAKPVGQPPLEEAA
jgi:hypothetical protein